MVRSPAGRGPGLSRGRGGRGHGAARPERLREDDHPSSPHRLPAAILGDRPHRRPRRRARRARGARRGSATCPRTCRSTTGCASGSFSSSWPDQGARAPRRRRSGGRRDRAPSSRRRPASLIGKLSRGYRQRVAIAQALLGNPDLLILDEPTNGLDPRQIIEMRGHIRALAGERTVLVTSHILGEIERVADRVAILLAGRLLGGARAPAGGRAGASGSGCAAGARRSVPCLAQRARRAAA